MKAVQFIHSTLFLTFQALGNAVADVPVSVYNTTEKLLEALQILDDYAAGKSLSFFPELPGYISTQFQNAELELNKSYELSGELSPVTKGRLGSDDPKEREKALNLLKKNIDTLLEWSSQLQSERARADEIRVNLITAKNAHYKIVRKLENDAILPADVYRVWQNEIGGLLHDERTIQSEYDQVIDLAQRKIETSTEQKNDLLEQKRNWDKLYKTVQSAHSDAVAKEKELMEIHEFRLQQRKQHIEESKDRIRRYEEKAREMARRRATQVFANSIRNQTVGVDISLGSGGSDAKAQGGGKMGFSELEFSSFMQFEADGETFVMPVKPEFYGSD